MSDTVIQVRDLGKQYRIGAEEADYRTIRDSIEDALKAPFRRAWRLMQGEVTGAAELDETIWALRDVSFDVERGEVLGVIGSNGAGKSTLLKLLSRITEPTEGYAEIKGRTGSLLEVGTGFHPELTGEENVYLNGTILGMGKDEVERKFDEIVEFAGVRKFITTPVKHYSSGMKVRLAFAVAAHLDPEILLIDEVLSVGDASFQRKCLGKMGEIADGGRTVLFVSHRMDSVTQLCTRAMWLKDGQVELTRSPSEVVEAYLSSDVELTGEWERPDDEPDSEVEIQRVCVLDDSGERQTTVPFTERFHLEIDYEIREEIRDLSVFARITNTAGVVMWTSWDTDATEWRGAVRQPGSYRSTCHVPGEFLRPGRYFLSVGALIDRVRAIETFESIIAFDVSAAGFQMNRERVGIVTPTLDWDVSELSDARDAALRS